MNMSPHLINAHAEQARRRLKRKEAKLASQTLLDGGATTYLDNLPGIGVVLEFPNGRKCYFKNTDLAITMWYRKYARDFGTKVDPKDHLSDLVKPKERSGFTRVTYEEWSQPGWTFGPLGVNPESLKAA
jgi:hypothetical protein